MRTHAATATPSLPVAALAILALIIFTVGYITACWLYPFTPCRRCHGTGKHRAILGKTFRLCRHCHGDGHVLRPGRRVLNYLRVLHDKGNPR